MKKIGEPQEGMSAYEYEDPPEGWMPATDVYYKLRRSQDIISELLIRAVDKDPNDAGLFRGKDGQVHKFYSPSIVEEVERMFKERDESKVPPKGWASLKELGLPIFNNDP